MATQDSLRLHSQWPLSSARGHSAFLVQLQGRGAALAWHLSAPGPGQGWTPGFRAGLSPRHSPALNDAPATVGVL